MGRVNFYWLSEDGQNYGQTVPIGQQNLKFVAGVYCPAEEKVYAFESGTTTNSIYWTNDNRNWRLYVGGLGSDAEKAIWSDADQQMLVATYGKGIFYKRASSESFEQSNLSDGRWTDVASGDGAYVAISSSNLIAYSLDGRSWVEEELKELADDPSRLISVCFVDGNFVAVSSEYKVLEVSAETIKNSLP